MADAKKPAEPEQPEQAAQEPQEPAWLRDVADHSAVVYAALQELYKLIKG